MSEWSEGMSDGCVDDTPTVGAKLVIAWRRRARSMRDGSRLLPVIFSHEYVFHIWDNFASTTCGPHDHRWTSRLHGSQRYQCQWGIPAFVSAVIGFSLI